MDFILQEAEEDAPTLQFSDDEGNEDKDTSSLIDDPQLEQKRKIENRNFVEFDKFDKFEKSVEHFKKTLLKFDEVENHLLFTVIYGIMYHKTDTENIKKEGAQEILGNDLYFDLLEIEPNQQIFIDKSLFGFFQRCK